MIATCNLCGEIIVGPEPVPVVGQDLTPFEFRSLNHAMTFHFWGKHPDKVSDLQTSKFEMLTAVVLSALVTSSDPRYAASVGQVREALKVFVQPEAPETISLVSLQ